MKTEYQARWTSKQKAETLRKSLGHGRALLLDTFNGFIVIEPRGSHLGDGKVLSSQEADYELQEVWCQEPRTKLAEARRMLGLDSPILAESLAV